MQESTGFLNSGKSRQEYFKCYLLIFVHKYQGLYFDVFL